MTRIIYVVYTKEYLTSRQIIGANLKKYAFLCDYSEVKIDDLIDSPMYSTPMQVVSISPCESLADTVVNGVNPMILAMAEDGIDMKDLMILQMMQGSNDGQMNPMFMMAMMDKGGNNSMIETMLMMQMMGNNQMSFPFMPNQSQKEEK